MTCRTGSTILLWSHGRTPVLVRKDPISLSCGHPLFPCSVGVQAQSREAGSSPRDGRDGSNRKPSTTHQNLRQQPGFHGTEKGEAFGFELGTRLTEKILQKRIQSKQTRRKGSKLSLTTMNRKNRRRTPPATDGRNGRWKEEWRG